MHQWIASAGGMAMSPKFVNLNPKCDLPRQKRNFLKWEKNWRILTTQRPIEDCWFVTRWFDNHQGKLFRRRFRVQFQLFQIIVKICKQKIIIGAKNSSRIKIERWTRETWEKNASDVLSWCWLREQRVVLIIHSCPGAAVDVEDDFAEHYIISLFSRHSDRCSLGSRSDFIVHLLRTEIY